MEGAHGLIHRFLGRTRGAGLDHLREKAGLFVIQRNGHSCDSFFSQPSSITRSNSSASSGERAPAVRVKIAWRSSSLIRLSRCTKSAATYSLAGGSAFRSSTMFSRGLTTLTVHRRDGPWQGAASDVEGVLAQFTVVVSAGDIVQKSFDF